MDTSTSSTDSPQLAELKNRAAIIEQHKKIIDALTPALPEGAKGTIALSGEHVEIKLLAYRQLNTVADKIGIRVRKAEARKVIIHDATSLQSLAGYHGFTEELKGIAELATKEIALADTVIDPSTEPPSDGRRMLGGAELVVAAQLVPLLITAGVKTATGIASLFRRNVTGTSVAVAIGDTALVAAVCGELMDLPQRRIDVYHPGLMAPLAGQTSALLERLKKLSELRVGLDERLVKLAAAKAAKAGAGPEGQHSADKDSKSGVTTTIKADGGDPAAAEMHARLMALAEKLDELRSALTKADEDGATPLAGLLRAEALVSVAEGAHVLSLKVEAAGGASQAADGGIRSSDSRFSGGVIVNFILFDATGRIVDAATLSAYSGLRSSEEPGEPINLID